MAPITRSKDKDANDATTGEKRENESAGSDSKKPRVEKKTSPSREERGADPKHTHGSNDERHKPSPSKKTGAVEPGKETRLPVSILEKGIVYFFIRGRVDIENPSRVDEIARSYILLHPINKDAKLGEGSISDSENNRLLVLPKKTFPRSSKERFMVFLEKAAASFETIRETFLAGADYTTKTSGTHHTPAAKPVGEGVYAITSTGRESHLAYILTLPEEPGELQKEIDLRERGSFIISTKNPSYRGPAYAQFTEKPEFSKEIMDEFRSLRWLPSKPAHLDYINAQFLLIGESAGIKKATKKQEIDDEEGKRDPGDVLEALEEKDLERMRHLSGRDSASIYADLEASKELSKGVSRGIVETPENKKSK